LLENMTEVRPLGSIPFPELLRYYGPLRLPAADAIQVIDSLKTLPFVGTAPGLPGSSTDLSARALPNHPGRLDRCAHSLLACRWQASPSQEGWPPPAKCNEAESGSLTLGLAPSSSGEFSSPSPPTLWAGNRPAARGRLPCTGGRNYMLNEQLTCPTPCSRIDQPGFVLAHQRAQRIIFMSARRPTLNFYDTIGHPALAGVTAGGQKGSNPEG
jgi:hypothetical protein